MAFLRQEARVIERFRIIEVAEAESVTEAARRLGCSLTTVYKLLGRYREGGLRALMNRPRGPREPIPEEVVDLVVELKASAPHRATSKVQQLLEERYGLRLSRQSIWRILSARGLARIMDPEPLVRFQRPQPNQLWQMDLKEAVVFPFGKAHLLYALDDASRFCVGGVWIRDKKEPTVLGALAQILEQAGLPKAMDIVQLKREYGNALCLMGNIDLGYTLTRGTPEEVEAEVKERIRVIAPGGGYCLGSSNSVPEYVPLANFNAMREAGFRYGRYPISV